MSKTLELTRRLLKGEPLTNLSQDFYRVADEFMEGQASPVGMSAFLTAMALRGETADLLAAFAASMRRHAVPFFPGQRSESQTFRVDTCGTGGDHSGTFNVSTAAAFVVAGAGIPVVKHGNRGITSRSGSADVLEALGVEIDVPPDVMHQRFVDSGFAFLFAPTYHPAMRHVGPVRRELGFRTLFNLVGPLANPALATHQVVGVYSAELVPVVAGALQKLGLSAALVVHGHGGVDEITLSGPSRAMALMGGELQDMTIDPSDLGLVQAGPEELAGGAAEDNAKLIEGILRGEAERAVTDVVVLNAGASIALTEGELNLAKGIERARESITSGKALEVLSFHRHARGIVK